MIRKPRTHAAETGAREIASAPRLQARALPTTPAARAAAIATDQGQSVRGSHDRVTIGAIAAATKSRTHWACKIARAALAPRSQPRARRASRTHAAPMSKAMPGMQGT